MATKHQAAQSIFSRERHMVGNVGIEMLVAGQGEPLMLWHGGGTIGGFDFAAPLADRFKIMIPYHPGFGPSDDNIGFADMEDYALHYLTLLDQLRVDRFHLIGISMGGWMAAEFAARNPGRIGKLVLVAPAGLKVPDHPITDIFKIRPADMLSYLTPHAEAYAGMMPGPGNIDAIVAMYREETSVARLAWDRFYNPRLPRWLPRISAPTLLVWGDRDRIVPVGQAESWQGLIPDAEIRIIPGGGHMVLAEEPAAIAEIGDFLA